MRCYLKSARRRSTRLKSARIDKTLAAVGYAPMTVFGLESVRVDLGKCLVMQKSVRGGMFDCALSVYSIVSSVISSDLEKAARKRLLRYAS